MRRNILVCFFQNTSAKVLEIGPKGSGHVEHFEKVRQIDDRFGKAGPAFENLEKPLAIGTRKKQELHEAILREMTLEAEIVLFKAGIKASSDTTGL